MSEGASAADPRAGDLAWPAFPAGIRRATPEDVPAILALIRGLAVYEREPDAVLTTEEMLRSTLFGAVPRAWCLIAEQGGEPVGIALFFLNYSTWTGTHGVYLEDLFVTEEARGSGLGKALLASLAAIAVANGFRRFEWVVLDWNEPSIRFYEAMGARRSVGWSTYRLDGDALTGLAARAGG